MFEPLHARAFAKSSPSTIRCPHFRCQKACPSPVLDRLRRRRGEQRASPGEVLHALGLEAGEYLAGPVGGLARQTGEAGDVDAVGGGLGTLLDAV